MSQQDNQEMAKYFYRASAVDFGKIPGSPVAYWMSKSGVMVFEKHPLLEQVAIVKTGMTTADNDRFLRLWFEVSSKSIGLNIKNSVDALKSAKKWFPYNKGGGFRKWSGLNENLINWWGDGIEIKQNVDENGKRKASVRAEEYYFKPSITYSSVTSSSFSARLSDSGYLFDSGGSSVFPNFNSDMMILIGVLCSKIPGFFLSVYNETINFQPGDVARIPILSSSEKALDIKLAVTSCLQHSKADWDHFETSWDFKVFSLLRSDFSQLTIDKCFQSIRLSSENVTLEMQRLEEENNRLFIDAYGLQDELTPEVPLSEITLTCNPHYRYGGNLTDEEREARLQSDTLTELVSYAIGCMMGRYSLDREGLVYAHAGNVGFKELVAEGAYTTFAADDDGILPLTSEHWFADDVAARIEAFVRTVWGADTLEENLQFIADSLCLYAIKSVKKGGETARETIRRYLSTQFFKDHLKTYKKRPIYWLFSSGKEKAFECLVYLHRYNEATLPRMRTEYVTPLLGQMASRIERLRLQKADASTAEAKRLDKEIDSLTKQLAELRAFDDQLKHHADMKITLDLDDGVKVNYGKFGTLLSDVKAITGDKGE